MSTVDTSTAEELNQGGSDFILTSLEAMRKKLLDLTSRNRLLNFPITQKGSSLRIVGKRRLSTVWSRIQDPVT